MLASLPFVQSPDVSLEKRGELVGFIRGEVSFEEGASLLFFRELIDMRLPVERVMYAYHYQKVDGTLIFRYDNTAHHKSVPTFPHHKHGINGVMNSDVPSLEDVLREIESLILDS